MKRVVVFATSNKGKLREIREILKGFADEVVALEDIGFTGDIEETGKNFEENARIKAVTAHKWIKSVTKLENVIVMADDSGLEIKCLNGEPGVYSARYLGDVSYAEKSKVLINRVNEAGTDRLARYVCSIVAVLPNGDILNAEEYLNGEIARKPSGDGGFAYDPIFYIPELGKTAAELSVEEKNAISHRGKALRAMRDKLISLV